MKTGKRSSTRGRAAVLAGVFLLTGGCKVMTIDEDRTIRARTESGFDATRYVGTIWRDRLLPQLDRQAVPLAELVPAAAAGLDAFGSRRGRRAGEGSAWTFATRGTGTVTTVDRRSRRGMVELTVDGLPPDRRLRVQVGPIVAGTSIRDAADFLAFDDFTDQLAYADVGRALNARALAGIARDAAALRPGTRVRFMGTLALAAPGGDLVLTPVTLAPVAPPAG